MAVQVLPFTIPTSAPCDIAGVKFRPQAAIFWTSNVDADGELRGAASRAIGFATIDQSDALRQCVAACGGSVVSLGLSDAGHMDREDWVLAHGQHLSDFSVPYHAVVDDFSCALSFLEPYEPGYQIKCGGLIIGGKTVDTAFDTLLLPADADSVTVSGLPWKPKLVFLLATYPVTNEGANTSFGAANEDGDQWAYCSYTDYLGTLSSQYAYSRLKSGHACDGMRTRTGSVEWESSLTMNSDGFTLNVLSRPTYDVTVYWLAIYDSDADAGFAVGITDTVGDGSHSVTGLSFSPEAVMCITNAADDENVRVNDWLGLGAADNSRAFDIWDSELGDVDFATEWRGCLTDGPCCHFQNQDILVYIDETLTSFDSNGMTFTGTTDVGPAKMGYVALLTSPGSPFDLCAPPIVSFSPHTTPHRRMGIATTR